MKHYLLYFVLAASIASCHSNTAIDATATDAVDARTPVTLITASRGPMQDFVELNATSTFQQSSVVKANINGYIESVNISLNQLVGTSQLAFVLKTKEAKALGSTINVLDSSFKFSGTVKVFTTVQGYVTQLNHQVGDYVQDGEQLALVSDAKSFGFLLNLPYELKAYLPMGGQVQVELPDQTKLTGTVKTILPALDSVSQTLSVLINVASSAPIPQNLIAKVRIVKSSKGNALSLPKAAILTDEAQSSFWVMKMMDSITAVKVPISKGLEVGGMVEIISPQFVPSDKILLTGNYGLGDTAKVNIMKEKE